MITVVVAEDQAMVLGALVALVRTDREIDVVGSASNGSSALKLVVERAPDILLTDIEMPTGMNGMELAAEIKRLSLPTHVIMLTTFARPGYLRRSIDSGARGYLLKDSPPEKLTDAIRRVHAGLRVVDPEVAKYAMDQTVPLTHRERQTLRLAEEGRSGPDIAAALHLSSGTVRNYFSTIMNKLHAATRTEAARIARDKGLL